MVRLLVCGWLVVWFGLFFGRKNTVAIELFRRGFRRVLDELNYFCNHYAACRCYCGGGRRYSSRGRDGGTTSEPYSVPVACRCATITVVCMMFFLIVLTVLDV